jgi:tRNA U34 2-thiouridine synthase MnmA/TrmU
MKALSVFSGGLDSILATQLIRCQGIEVQAIFFKTPFFSSDKAENYAKSIGVPLKVIDITEEHLDIVKEPKHGYGRNMNPCIDCHSLMLRTALKMLEQENASFILTGDVLGQRSMSQKRKALELIENETGIEGLVLRPLSAKRLPITLPEKLGWIDRKQLMGFTGKSRKPQIKLAEELNIKEYPSPAGGCLLTDKVFSERLRDLFAYDKAIEIRDIELLKFGRHFRTCPESKIIIGRNHSENQAIQNLSNVNDLLLHSIEIPGPAVLVTGKTTPEVEKMASVMTVSYSDSGDKENTKISFKRGGIEEIFSIKGKAITELKQYMI